MSNVQKSEVSRIIHIGMGKAASSTLQKQFQNHNEIFFQTKVHGMYGDLETNCLKQSTLLKSVVISDEKIGYHLRHEVLGAEIIPFDLLVIKKIRDQLYVIDPNTIILIVDRDIDDDFISSCYNQQVKAGYYKSIRKFKLEAASFFSQISEVESIFAEKFRVKKILFSLLKADHQKFYNELAETLGVCASGFILKLKENEKHTLADQFNIRIFNLLLYYIIMFVGPFFLWRKSYFQRKIFRMVQRNVMRKKLYRIFLPITCMLNLFRRA